MIEAAIQEALSHVEEACDLTIRLHADDLKLLKRANSPLLLGTARGGKTVFQASSEVSRGGCMVQTRFGWLDARRETKFELLKQSLED
jgi:flagellar assembly protein FliH